MKDFVQTATGRRTYQRGQALVEFLLLLFILMALAAGMCFVIRILTFQFWAQQEARFLAFEQTWSPAAAHGSPAADAIEEIADGSLIRRPGFVTNLDVDKQVEDAGSVSDILPLFARAESGEAQGDAGYRQILLAKSVVAPWFEGTAHKRRERGKGFQLVETAYASLRSDKQLLKAGDRAPDEGGREPVITFDHFPKPRTRLERAFVKVVRNFGFGGALCPTLAAVARRNKAPSTAAVFEAPACGTDADRAFGVHLARHVDFKHFFRSYGYRLERRMSRASALKSTVRVELANQFYSFFNKAVQLSAPGIGCTNCRSQAGGSRARQYTGGGVGAPEIETVEQLGVASDPSVIRMITEMRYIGSSIALGEILEKMGETALQDPSNHDPQLEKDFEDTVNAVLHEDAHADELTAAQFMLPPSTLPLPPEFGPLAGGLQSGLMKNVLSQDTNLFDEQIENSNKEVIVTYEADKGIFPAARRRFDTEGITLSGRFFLITQPWHIPRRTCPTCDYRELGDERDGIDDDTEEGVLRRRVLGLWLFPKQPTAMLDAVSGIPELNSLDGVFSAFSAVDDAISEIAGFIADNPLRDISDALSELPIVGDLIPVIPQFPAVRPQAYPGSEEMTDDNLMGNSREFSDYVEEQKEFKDRAANPSFN